VDPLGRVAGVTSKPVGRYEARGFPQLLGFAAEVLVVGCDAGLAAGSGVGV
jgi:hypothetical protein